MARGPPATKWLADYTGRFSWWKRPYFILMETGTYFGYRFAFLTIIILPKSPKWRLTGCLTYCRTYHLALLLWSGTHFTENKVYQWIQTVKIYSLIFITFLSITKQLARQNRGTAFQRSTGSSRGWRHLSLWGSVLQHVLYSLISDK